MTLGTRTEQVPKLKEIILDSLKELSPQDEDALHNIVVYRFHEQNNTVCTLL